MYIYIYIYFFSVYYIYREREREREIDKHIYTIYMCVCVCVFKTDTGSIKRSNNVYVKANKSRNYYFIKKRHIKKLIEKACHQKLTKWLTTLELHQLKIHRLN